MKKTKIKTDLSGLRDADLNSEAQAIDTALTGNPAFTTVDEEKARAHDASEAYSLALAGKATGTKADKVIKDDARTELLDALRVLGIKLNIEADGDEAKLRTTGFPLAGDRSGKAKLGKPEGLSVAHEAGHGNMKLTVNKVARAKHYLFQYTKSPVTANSVWTDCPSSTIVCHITGLESRVEYAFRVAVLGAGQAVSFSDEINAYTI